MSLLKCLFPCCYKESEIDKLVNINFKQISPKKMAAIRTGLQ